VEFDAVVLAGGRATRLGGADKASIEVDGESLLERALTAVVDARRVVVVGAEHATSRPVLWARESPPYGGPVAAAYAGLDALGRAPGLVVVLAVDMPEVTAGTVGRLLAGVPGHEGAVLVEGGRRHLAFAVEADALEGARPDETAGAAMRDLWSSLDLVEVGAHGGEARDVDRWTDLDPRG
jgi:molybdopterin-guanine dinucleotide biosynthesis protein A